MKYEPNSYFLIDHPDGALEVFYVTPCSTVLDVAIIKREEKDAPNPTINFMVGSLGLNGLEKMVAMLKGWQAMKKANGTK